MNFDVTTNLEARRRTPAKPIGTFQKTEPVSEVVRTAQVAAAAERVRTRPNKEDRLLRKRQDRLPKHSRKIAMERRSIQLKRRLAVRPPRNNEGEV